MVPTGGPWVSCGSTTVIEVSYPYNETFKRYAEPRAGKRAQEFVNAQNKLKGGHWVLHDKATHDAQLPVERRDYMKYNYGLRR